MELTKELLDKMYWKDGLGIGRIANELCVSQRKVRDAMITLEIPRRKLQDVYMNTKGMLGKKHSPETIQKLREAKLGTKHSEETRRKISQANLNRTDYKSGSLASNWKGGVYKQKSDGRIFIHNPNHSRANANGYVKRAVIVVEEMIGRELLDYEIVHHINHDTSDDRPENLKVMTANEHSTMHNRERAKAKREAFEAKLRKEKE